MKPGISAEWRSAILVCRKCTKKLDGGFGPKGKAGLAKALRKATGGKKGRKARLGVVEVGCLGVCPKGAVTLVDTAHPREWLIVRAGTPVEDVAARLGARVAQASE